jgi:hypothetical protein
MAVGEHLTCQYPSSPSTISDIPVIPDYSVVYLHRADNSIA